MKKLLSMAAAGVLAVGCAAAEMPVTEVIAAIVNGEELTYSTYQAYETNYINSYRSYGLDVEDEAVRARIQDTALTAAIEDLLMEQDMRAQDCYEFTPEIDAWLTEQGKSAYENALVGVGEYLRAQMQLTTDEEVSFYALQYAETLGVTEQDYIDTCRRQYAYAAYCQWLTTDCPVTEADVENEYQQRTAQAEGRFANDVPAFELAVQNDEEVWYKPAGYRGILQILLPAEGATEAEKLASVQPVLDEIEAALQAGESFVTVAARYNTDLNMSNEAFVQTGYQVHPDSVMWEDAFKNAALAMEAPGDHSAPVVSDLGIHILYYLNDAPDGPVQMTQNIFDALQYSIYTQRVQEKLTQRMDELAAEATVIINEF